DRDAGDTLAGESRCEAIEVGVRNVLGVDRSARSQTLRESHGVVTVAGPDVGDPHPRLDTKAVQHALRLTVRVTLRLGRIGRRNDRCDRTIGRREPRRLSVRRADAPRPRHAGREENAAPADLTLPGHDRRSGGHSRVFTAPGRGALAMIATAIVFNTAAIRPAPA